MHKKAKAVEKKSQEIMKAQNTQSRTTVELETVVSESEGVTTIEN